MYVLDGKYDFTVEDLERVSRFVNSPENEKFMTLSLGFGSVQGGNA